MVRSNKLAAIVPIKKLSQRVPGKNFRQLGDKPLYEWVIGTLQNLEFVERIVVNIDEPLSLPETIFERFPKVEVSERPQRLKGHEVSMNKIIEYEVDRLEVSDFLMTHVTNPFITAHTFLDAYKKYTDVSDGKMKCLFSVNEYRSRFYDVNIDPINHDPDLLIQTQDLSPIYEENSCFYFFSREAFKLKNSRISSGAIPFVTPRLESVDIDNEEDWEIVTRLVDAGPIGREFV